MVPLWHQIPVLVSNPALSKNRFPIFTSLLRFGTIEGVTVNSLLIPSIVNFTGLLTPIFDILAELLAVPSSVICFEENPTPNRL